MDVEGKPRSDRALIGQMLASISTLNAHRRGAITRDGFFFGTGTIGKFPERHYAHTGGTLSRTSSPRSRAVVGERYGCRDVLLSASLRAARSEVVGTCKISSRRHKSGSREAMQQITRPSCFANPCCFISHGALEGASISKRFQGLEKHLPPYCKTLCITCS